METNYVTPIEKRGDFWFKREDLYKPYEFSPANGSKLRQCQLLVQKNFDKSRNGIITGTSILSPQAVIAASVAKELGVPCEIYYGGTKKELLKEKKYPRIASELGANVSIVSKMGYTSVLAAKAEESAIKNDYFHIRYGFDFRQNLDCFVDSVACQVSNIPSNIRNIAVTVGSSITLIGILYGLAIYGGNVENLYAIGCAPNRMGKIQDYANMIYFETGISLPVDKIKYIDAFSTMKGFKYENTVSEEYCGISFHPRYEAKTFRWLKHQSIGNCLMWVTGADFG